MSRPSLSVHVLLACGHRVRTRNVPLPRTTITCTAGRRCGYLQEWVSADCAGRTFYNGPRPEAEETAPTTEDPRAR